VAGGMLSRIQKFIEVGDQKINENQVRFNKMPDIFNFTAQSEPVLSDDTDHTGDIECFENQYYQVEVEFSELLHSVVDHYATDTVRQAVVCQKTVIILQGHM